MIRIAIAGATGLSGSILLKLLESFPCPLKIHLIASEKSQGKSLPFKNEAITINPLNSFSFEKIDYVFFATDAHLSLKYAKKALKAGCIVIDLSSAFRLDLKVPLVIPEINGNLLNDNPSIIASPNCTTTMMLLALHPLHKMYRLKSIVASTYQAASGGGSQLLQNLLAETKQYIEGAKKSFHYAFNIYPHPQRSNDPHWNLEEIKMILETKKILSDENLNIYPTCIRVPTIKTHSLSLHATFHKNLDLSHSLKALQQCPSLKILDQIDSYTAENRPEIFCSRIRLVKDNVLEMWVTADQLLKGASLNAFQIFQHLVKEKACIGFC